MASSSDDLDKLAVPEVLAKLEVDPQQGLTSAEAQTRLGTYGANALEEKEESRLSKLLGYFKGPISYMIEAAALVSALLHRWDDFAIIAGLLAFNAALGFWQDSKAANALAELKKGLALKAQALRDGRWQTVDATSLVPGDIVDIKLGEVVPADLKLIEGKFASIDQSALTGESVPVSKKPGDPAYSGSVVKQGEMTGVVTATGGTTFFGRTAKLVAAAGAVSHAQKAMFQIGNFLIVVAVVLAFVIVGFDVYRDIVVADTWGASDALAILQFVLILLVAAIPVAMPAVFSITMALGALALSKQKAIVSRLASIEEMAGVDILCSDKTGTLTKNQLTLGEPILFGAKDAAECLQAAALATKADSEDAIDVAVMGALKDKAAIAAYRQTDFEPFDPAIKRTRATIADAQGNSFMVAKGMPEAVLDLVKPDAATADKLKQTVAQLAARGYRALGVARSQEGDSGWTFLGVLPMFDPPRDDSKATIDAARAKGVSVKMITGDDTAIAIETARQLGLGTNILTAAEFFPKDLDPDHVPAALAEGIEKADGFARVFPEHKYAVVKALQGRGHLVAMTGDGVNDAPALKQADCGTAVSGATDAARSAAALILTAPGLSVINNAIDEARRIFGRINSYTIYRVALTLNIMFLVTLSTVFFQFTPLTAVMIVILALLDDLPIMAIAYDNTEVAAQPIRWRMPRVLGIASVLAFATIVQTMGLLLIGLETLSDPSAQAFFHLSTREELQTVMFLQVALGGHLLLYNTRTANWFFLRPWPSLVLIGALLATEILAVLMAGFGWLVPQLHWATIGWAVLYMIGWMFVIDVVKHAANKLADFRDARAQRSIAIVQAPLQGHVPPVVKPNAA